MLDDLGREAVAAVAEGGHADILSDTPLAPDPVSVTMPVDLLSRGSCNRSLPRLVMPVLEADIDFSSVQMWFPAFPIRPQLRKA